MSGPEALVPLVLFISVSATVFGALYLRSRENMGLIERGINPRVERAQVRPKHLIALKYGMLIAGLGLGLLIAFFCENAFFPPKPMIDTNSDGSSYTYYRQKDNIEAMYFALLGLGGGVGLLVSYLVERKEWEGKKAV